MNKKIRVFDSDNEELGPLFLAKEAALGDLRYASRGRLGQRRSRERKKQSSHG